ncbi:Protein FAM49B [Neolecta irregularis DAH-3]|uniref:Protein FAM49B n=1 Tax=Neolecta irregularis (strain DAH-3) TaxID=1198029 RepID=A0A1U7LH75_NEOID|nr:Protein FAM49B [Neolecta irregularis DAH-3]|eukprot:OLL21953.1 Protein FAM49B [Neolecta irregularis DAH-3]
MKDLPCTKGTSERGIPHHSQSVLSSAFKHPAVWIGRMGINVSKNDQKNFRISKLEGAYIDERTIKHLTPAPEFQLIRIWEDEILATAETFGVSGEAIRTAIASGLPCDSENARKDIEPAIQLLKHYYEFSEQLNAAICGTFDSVVDLPWNSYERHSLHFEIGKGCYDALKFDLIKLRKPEMQNILAIYRRMLRLNLLKDIPHDEFQRTDKLSQFIAHRSPMANGLCTAFVRSSEGRIETRITTVLAMIHSGYTVFTQIGNSNENSDRPTIRRCMPPSEIESLVLFSLTMMMILYDNIDKAGVFVKNSPVDLPEYIKIVERIAVFPTSRDFFDLLRWNSKTFNIKSASKLAREVFR